MLTLSANVPYPPDSSRLFLKNNNNSRNIKKNKKNMNVVHDNIKMIHVSVRAQYHL